MHGKTNEQTMEAALEICMKHLVDDHKFIVSLGSTNTYYRCHDVVAYVKSCRAQATRDLLMSTTIAEAVDAIDRGADVNASNVLHRAILTGYTEKILMHEDFCTETANDFGTLADEDSCAVTPLQAAFVCDNPVIFEDLLEYGADPDVQLSCGCRIVHHAVRESPDLNFLRILIEYDVEGEYTDSRGNTPLHIAVSNNRMEAVAMLLQDGVNPDITNDEHETPFYTTVLQGNLEMMDHLLSLHVVPTKDVLKAVVDFGEVEMMELILQQSSFDDDLMLTLMEYADDQGQRDIVTVLNDHM